MGLEDTYSHWGRDTAACFIAVFPLCCSFSTYPHHYTGWAPGLESIPNAPIQFHGLSSWKLRPEPIPGAQSYPDEFFLALLPPPKGGALFCLTLVQASFTKCVSSVTLPHASYAGRWPGASPTLRTQSECQTTPLHAPCTIHPLAGGESLHI